MSASISLTVTESNVNQNANTSVVKVTLRISASGQTHNGYSQYVYIMIDGTKYTFHHSFSQNATTTLATKSKTVTHSADGSKSVTVKGYYETGVSPGNLSKTVTKTLTTIARQYTVIYNANSGSGAPGNQIKTYGVNLTLQKSFPTRSGYTFLGWSTNSSASSPDSAYTAAKMSSGVTYTSNSALTLYAVWTQIKYPVTYNANGGSGAPAAQEKIHGDTLTLQTGVPTRTSGSTTYTFAGWGTSATATTPSYQPGGSYTGNAALNLYAIWSLEYSSPVINSVSIYRCNSSGTKSLSGDYVKMVFTWTAGITPTTGTQTYSTKVKVTYGSGTVWKSETTSTAKSATVTVGPTQIDYTPNLAATITLTDTKATEDNITTQNILIPNIGLPVDISPNENNITLFGVCYESKNGLIVNGNEEISGDLSADNVYANNIGRIYSATNNHAITGANTMTFGASITVPPGTYIINGFWSFETANRGAITHMIQVGISKNNSVSSPGNVQYTRIWSPQDAWHRLNVSTIQRVTAQQTFWVSGYASHTHPSALTGISAIRIA